MRYGVGRTRMADIAAEAGVVRQTLYSFFKNKNEILCAAIRHYSDISLSEIRQEWERLEDLDDQLDVFFEHAIVASFAMISASPDARDMIGGYNASGKAETERAQMEKINAWSEVLAAHQLSRNKKKISTERLAEYIVLSSIGLRDQARDEQQLRILLEIQKSAIIALLE